MGCDIHMNIEVQEQGTWISVPFTCEPWRERSAELASWWKEYDEEIAAGAAPMPQAFCGRNYVVFAILAGVRQSDPRWPVIAKPRGLPDGWPAEKDTGDHSETYLTLEEITAYPWDTTVTTRYGYVQVPAWRTWLASENRSGGPFPRCGDTSGKKISEQDAQTWRGTLPDDVYVRVSWKDTARDATHDWPGQVLPRLEQIAAGRPLRLVFGFDN